MIARFFLLALAATPTDGGAFRFLDVEAMDDRPIVTYRPVELGLEPVRPISWEIPPPPKTRFGLATVGPAPETALAVAWDPDGPTLWIDADGDGRISDGERHALKPDGPLAVPASIVADPKSRESGRVRRMLLFRTGLLGEGVRFAVRGGMEGTLALGGRRYRAILTDGNADGCFDAAGVDRVSVDLDGDGRFDPVTERFPLGTPIRLGSTTYTVTSDPWAHSVAAHERDNRLGRLRLDLSVEKPGPAIARIVVNLVGRSGELVAIDSIGEARAIHVGDYRIASFDLDLADPEGRVWTYHFTGGHQYTIAIGPDRESRASLLDGLALDLSTNLDMAARPGEEIDVTPTLHLASDAFLASCTTRRQGTLRDNDRNAEIVLKSPDGQAVDRAYSGFR